MEFLLFRNIYGNTIADNSHTCDTIKYFLLKGKEQSHSMANGFNYCSLGWYNERVEGVNLCKLPGQLHIVKLFFTGFNAEILIVEVWFKKYSMFTKVLPFCYPTKYPILNMCYLCYMCYLLSELSHLHVEN